MHSNALLSVQKTSVLHSRPGLSIKPGSPTDYDAVADGQII